MRHRILMLGTLLAIAAVIAVAVVQLLRADEDGATDDNAAQVSTGPIKLLFDDAYPPGERVNVRIENAGTRAYRYQAFYAACFLSYSDSSGREFKIPPGTHCDILGEQPIEPGQVKRLFAWRLNECVKDRWGCVKSRPLPPGAYVVRGRFEPVGGGKPARAEARFWIVEAESGGGAGQ
ncbi:MAG: hypothetical protein AABM66_13365 [Actinomycetota bacterium]